jgi:hypothetical protein
MRLVLFHNIFKNLNSSISTWKIIYGINSLLSKFKNVIFPPKFIKKKPHFSVRDRARRRLAAHGSLQKEKKIQLLMNNSKY